MGKPLPFNKKMKLLKQKKDVNKHYIHTYTHLWGMDRDRDRVTQRQRDRDRDITHDMRPRKNAKYCFSPGK